MFWECLPATLVRSFQQVIAPVQQCPYFWKDGDLWSIRFKFLGNYDVVSWIPLLLEMVKTERPTPGYKQTHRDTLRHTCTATSTHVHTYIRTHMEEKLGISFEDIGTLGIFLDTKPGQGGHEGVPKVSVIWGRNWHPSTLLQQLGATLKVPSSDVLSHSCVSTESLGMNYSLCVYRAAPG